MMKMRTKVAMINKELQLTHEGCKGQFEGGVEGWGEGVVCD